MNTELQSGGTMNMDEYINRPRRPRVIVEWFVLDLMNVKNGIVGEIAILDKFHRLINDGWRVAHEQFISEYKWAARLEREVSK